jgi:hypothetical protein
MLHISWKLLTTLQWEFPDEFNRTVLEFLETVNEPAET